MQLDEHQILSFGGTPCYYDNMDFLNAKKTVTVYLQTGIENSATGCLNQIICVH